MKYLFVLLFFFLTGCAVTGGGTFGSPMWPTAGMEYDLASMPFEVNGKRFEGTGVIDRQASQTISFFLPKNTIKFMITTCNREKFTAYPDSNKPFKFNYIPIMFLENRDSCFMTATAITNKGETFKSLIDFRAGEDLTGSLACNGEEAEVVGAGFCQSRDGLIQRIDFDCPVAAVSQEGCPALNEVEESSFEFKIVPGFCTYKFADKDKKKFRLTTFGYTRISEVSEK